MPKQKNDKWLKYLEYNSIKNYLNGSIASKGAQIGVNINLEDKVKNVNLTNYLIGVEVFMTEYAKEFSYPDKIIDYYKEIRNNDEELNKFKQLIESYAVWLIKEKGLSNATATNYQAHLRGFLRWNNIILKFRNYKPKSEKSKNQNQLGMGYDELKEMSFKIITYATDFELKLLVRFCQISGLGSKEIFELTFKDLRYKDFEKEFVRIDGLRKKTGVHFTTFIYGDVKRDIQKYLKINSDKNDIEYLFGEPEIAYQNFQRRFGNAYDRMINAEYPQYQTIKEKNQQRLFTIHGYRHIFITLCATLRIPKHIENQFVAHADSNLGVNAHYILETELLENFKLVQEELFGVRETSVREDIEREMIANLTKVLMNKGKRKSIFNENVNATLEDLEQINLDNQMNYLLEGIIQEAKKNILDNPTELVNDENFVKALVSNDDFIRSLLKRFDQVRRSINF